MGQVNTISKVISIRESILEKNAKQGIKNVGGKPREFMEAKSV